MKQIATMFPLAPFSAINESNTGERELPMKQHCLTQNHLLINSWTFEIEKIPGSKSPKLSLLTYFSFPLIHIIT